MSAAAIALGAGQGVLLSLFAIAGTGKLAACRPGAAVMCRKGAFDLLMALMALAAWPAAAVMLAAFALSIAIGGWARERLRRNTACNCFGVLTVSLHRWRNHSRALMAVAALAMLAALAAGGTGAPAWPAIFGATALVLCVFSFLMAHGVRAARPRPAAAAAAPPPAPLDPMLVLGVDGTGQARSLRDLGRGDGPVVLLMMAEGCTACGALKRALLPLLERFPFPVHPVMEDAPAASALPAVLFDRGAVLRKGLGVRSMPALALLSPVSGALLAPCALGSEAIQAQLLTMLLAAPRPRAALQPEEAVLAADPG